MKRKETKKNMGPQTADRSLPHTYCRSIFSTHVNRVSFFTRDLCTCELLLHIKLQYANIRMIYSFYNSSN